MTLGMAVFWGGLIVLALWAIRRPESGAPSRTAEEILRERFARGEIDVTELSERLKVLG